MPRPAVRVPPVRPLPASASGRRRHLGALVALAASASGCGFQLRGSAGLPFRTLYAGFPPTSAIGADFRRLVRISGETQLVERPDAAEARLEVLGESREKEIVGFSSTGRPREYQLRQRFVFRLLDARGQELIAPTTLLLRREINTTDTQIVSKEQEEALLYREMQTDVVQQLLRRLAAVKRPGA